MKCESLFIMPVWMVWGLGVWGVLGIINYVLEMYLNITKRKLAKLEGK